MFYINSHDIYLFKFALIMFVRLLLFICIYFYISLSYFLLFSRMLKSFFIYFFIFYLLVGFVQLRFELSSCPTSRYSLCISKHTTGYYIFYDINAVFFLFNWKFNFNFNSSCVRCMVLLLSRDLSSWSVGFGWAGSVCSAVSFPGQLERPLRFSRSVGCCYFIVFPLQIHKIHI